MGKVLFVLHIPPPVHGSSVVGKSIMDSTVINSKIQCKYINLGTSKSLDEIGKNPFQKISLYLKILFRVIKQLIVFKPDVVYLAITAKGVGFYKDSVVVILAKMFGKKMVYHMHNQGVRFRQDRWFDNVLYKSVFSNSEVILLSKHLYHDIAKYVQPANVYYCANGIPDFNAGIYRKRDLKEREVQILFLSNLMKAKGVFVLLEACKLLMEKQLPFHCTFVGGESDITTETFLGKVSEFKLNGFVNYAGRKYGDEKIKVFSKADIFAMPSLSETFGLVNLEAMQFALPVVSTFEGGIPDVVEDGKTGFLVNKNDPQALAEKLEILIKNPELRLQMGELGRKDYEEKFTMETFEKCFSNILNTIIIENKTKG